MDIRVQAYQPLSTARPMRPTASAAAAQPGQAARTAQPFQPVEAPARIPALTRESPQPAAPTLAGYGPRGQVVDIYV